MNKEDADKFHALCTARTENALLRKEIQDLLELLKEANSYIKMGFAADDCDVYGCWHNSATDCSSKIEALLTQHGLTIS